MKVWIIDDDQEMTGAVQMMLRLLKHESKGFLSARAAAEAMVGGDRPDVILLDINMPKVSGTDFLEFMRRNRELRHVPVVMLTTEAADTMVDRTLAMGADAYVIKPVALEELAAAIKKALSAHGRG